MFAPMALAAERRLVDSSAQNYANMTWAFAAASQRVAPWLTALAREA